MTKAILQLDSKNKAMKNVVINKGIPSKLKPEEFFKGEEKEGKVLVEMDEATAVLTLQKFQHEFKLISPAEIEIRVKTYFGGSRVVKVKSIEQGKKEQIQAANSNITEISKDSVYLNEVEWTLDKLKAKAQELDIQGNIPTWGRDALIRHITKAEEEAAAIIDQFNK